MFCFCGRVVSLRAVVAIAKVSTQSFADLKRSQDFLQSLDGFMMFLFGDLVCSCSDEFFRSVKNS